MASNLSSLVVGFLLAQQLFMAATISSYMVACSNYSGASSKIMADVVCCQVRGCSERGQEAGGLQSLGLWPGVGAALVMPLVLGGE